MLIRLNNKNQNCQGMIKIFFCQIKNQRCQSYLEVNISNLFAVIFSVLITQINTVVISWYLDGLYFPVVTKETIAFNFLQFIPSLIASETLIVCGNLIGQQRENKLSNVIVSGLVVNFLICNCLVFIMFMIAPFLLSALSAQNSNIHGTNINELQFAVQYYRFLLLIMIVMSIIQVFISGIQACKYNRHVMIGAIISNIIVTLMLFVFKINILYTAFIIMIVGVFQLFYMLGFNLKYINYHNDHHFFKKIKLKFIKETVF